MIESCGWELYGMHGIYHSRVINVDLKEIMKNDICKFFT